MVRFVCASLTAALLLAFATPVVKSDDDRQFIKVEVKGTIKTHLVGPGGETTGTNITVTRAGKEDIVWELDLHGDPGIVELDPRWYQAAFTFVRAGFAHILEGPDHLLFLVLLVVPFRRFWPLAAIVTAFTHVGVPALAFPVISMRNGSSGEY